MPFKEVRDILRPFCTTNCIWDMCWLDSTRLQIIIDDHEVMRLRGNAFQLGNITCAAIADPRAAPFPSATAEEKNISLKIWVGKQVQTILRPATLPRTRKFLYDAIQASGEVAVQHAAKLAENIFSTNTTWCYPYHFVGRSRLIGVPSSWTSFPATSKQSWTISCSKTHEVEHPCCEGQFPLSQTPLKHPYQTSFKLAQDHSWNINGLVSTRNDLREHIAEVKPLLLMLQETNLDTNAFRFTAPKYSFIQHPASGPGKRGIALGFLAVLPAREIEGVPGTLILAKVPGLTEQQVWTVGSIYLGKTTVKPLSS
ncbi:hypothetical protein BASA84_000039 [Batrachochytrium salamandrivorans]|nr:hypothetical protein BASA84_000039 [Batrachochytrium salamandrivorans]